MLDFHVQRCTRQCAGEDRELLPGEVFYAVLIDEGEEVVRLDYSEAAWQGPPEDVIGWWRSRMPDNVARKFQWAPNDGLLDYFERLEDQLDRLDVRFVLALLMVRRRILRLEESNANEQGQEVMALFCPRNEKQYQVIVASPPADRMQQIQEELARLLEADSD